MTSSLATLWGDVHVTRCLLLSSVYLVSSPLFLLFPAFCCDCYVHYYNSNNIATTKVVAIIIFTIAIHVIAIMVIYVLMTLVLYVVLENILVPVITSRYCNHHPMMSQSTNNDTKHS